MVDTNDTKMVKLTTLKGYILSNIEFNKSFEELFCNWDYLSIQPTYQD